MIKIEFPTVDGGLLPWEFNSGKEVIDEISPEMRPPARMMVIEAETIDGRIATITIPYSESDKINISFEDEE
ncbi:MAG: hypothetical protein JKY43_04015 [Phycisphaerales bacterium]|nr:hypothetical protein [Phycisphaerales bacterium]